MLKLIKEVYAAGRKAGSHEAELRFREEEQALKEEINILKMIIFERDEEINLDNIEEID